MSEREDLERELQEVLRELGRRELLVAELEKKLVRCRFELEGMEQGRLIRSGEALAVMQGQAHRRSLQKELAALERKRAEAAEDVRRARERKVIVEGELERSAG